MRLPEIQAASRFFQVIPITVVFVLIGAFYGFSLYGAEVVGTFSDGIYYLFMADFLSPYSTELERGIASGILESRSYPPLYPAVLAYLGGGSGSVHAVHGVNQFFVLASFLLFYGFLIRETWLPRDAAFLTLVFALTPGVFLYSLLIVSEYLFISLLVASFVVLSLVAKDDDYRWAILATGLVALAILTRTVGVALLPVLAIVFAKRGRWDRLPLIAIALIPYAAWSWYQGAVLGSEGYLGFIIDYVKTLTPDELLNDIGENLSGLWLGWSTLLTSGYAALGVPNDALPFTGVGILVLGLLVGVGLVRETMRLQPVAVFVVTYSLIIALWPFPSHATRFLVPLYPFLILLAWRGVTVIGDVLPRRRAAASTRGRPERIALGLLVGLIMIPTLGGYMGRLMVSVPDALVPYTRQPNWFVMGSASEAKAFIEEHHRQIVAMQTLRSYVTPHDCVYTAFPELVAFYSRYPTHSIPPWDLDGATSSKGCSYVLMLNFTDSARRLEGLYPYRLIKNTAKPLFISYMNGGSEERYPVAILAELPQEE